MSITTEDGQAVDVEALNQQFARSMAAKPADSEPVAPAPPRRAPDEPKTPPAEKDKPKRTRKPRDSSKTISAPSDALQRKRQEAGAGILLGLSDMTEIAHTATGDEAWAKDTEMFRQAAPVWGKALADVAAHNERVAKYLDAESSGSAMAYFTLMAVTSQITNAVIENHGGVSKVRLFFQKAALKVKSIGRKK